MQLKIFSEISSPQSDITSTEFQSDITSTAFQSDLTSTAFQSDVNTTGIKLKPYIQPFEKILANAELAGLLDELEMDDVFGKEAPNYFSIPNIFSNDFFLQKFIDRAAYWQIVHINKELKPTAQVILEASEKLFNAKNKILESQFYENLPKSRKLRYGPHDIHEYRGKFFPQLVRAFLNIANLDENSIVIDPTCGSGTTNIESYQLGMTTLGADLNPLSVLIARTKTAIIDISPDELINLSDQLILKVFEENYVNIESIWSTDDLKYLKNWFHNDVLRELGLIITNINSVTKLVVADFFKVVLSNIIRAVSYQKEEDLRVRKCIKEYIPLQTINNFKIELERQLAKIIPYLKAVSYNKTKRQITPVPYPAKEILESDAKKIDSAFSSYVGKCDLLITSPPYATALPYLDTDRLSLVVLNLLPRKGHRIKDYDMIGNREISEKQRLSLWKDYLERKNVLPTEVCDFIDNLGNSYHVMDVGFRRKNLPALLAKYFLDMAETMKNSLKMMKPNSLGVYVVGNNSTTVGDIKIDIPTDKFLWEIGKKVGWHQEKVINMELLVSRDVFKHNRGSAESILIFKSSLQRKAIYLSTNENNVNDSSEWNFHNENTQEHLHSIHPYPARFIPQIPRKTILSYSEPGDIVLDPFSGSGTTALEAILYGRRSIGVDNNDVAVLIAKAKTNSYSQEDIKELLDFAEKIETISSFSPDKILLPQFENLSYWFSDNAIEELGKVRFAIDQLREPIKTFALVAFSSIIIKVSYQDSDTRYAKINRDYKSGSVYKFIKEKLLDSIKRLSTIANIDKERAEIRLGDSRILNFINDEIIDLIVTSPPYLNAYDYHKYHRQRIHWINGNVSFARDFEIGKHDTFTRPGATPDLYFEDMSKCFKEWFRVLKHNKKALIVVGDAIVNKKAVSVGEKFIKIMTDIGFKYEQHWIRKLQTNKKSFNQNARIDEEHVLLFNKP